MLSQDDFYNVSKNANLASIDFIISYKGKYLVGKRMNEAFIRMTKKELGISLEKKDFIFHCISQHWYKNNFRDNKFGTHYISLSFKKELTDDEYKLIDIKDQHSNIKWLTKEELLDDVTYIHTRKDFLTINFSM